MQWTTTTCSNSWDRENAIALKIGLVEGAAALGALVLDRKTNTAQRLMYKGEHPLTPWFSVNGGTVVLQAFSSGRGSNEPEVWIHRDGKHHVIKDAAFPSASDDGRMVACAVALPEGDDGGDNGPGTQIAVIDAATGKLTRLDVEGSLPDISPDGKHILFARYVGDEKYVTTVVGIDGKGAKELGPFHIEANDTMSAHPRWVGNDAVLVALHEPGSVETEVHLFGLDGKRTQITSNDAEDRLAQAIDDKRIAYLSNPLSDIEDADDDKEVCARPGELWVATREDGKWSHRKLGVEALDFRIAGDRLIYVSPDATKVLESSLDKPAKVRDLLKDVKYEPNRTFQTDVDGDAEPTTKPKGK